MSTKTKDQLLLTYRKSNKARRTSILAKAGFATEADYIAYLLAPDAVPEEKPIIHNIHIVDVSGSMRGPRLRGAVQGVNQEIDELKKDDSVEYTHSLVEFSGASYIKTIAWKIPIADVPIYSSIDRDSTALNDAIGQTLERLVKEMKGDEKILVKIFTDGGENASVGKYRLSSDLREFIKSCEAKGFTITFIGTASDVQHVIQNLSIDASNTFMHDNTERGIYLASSARGASTLEYSKKVLRKEDVSKGFYSKTLKNDK
jgi:uncharacterized protein YegL